MKQKKRLVALLLVCALLSASLYAFTGSADAKTLGQQKNELESQLSSLKGLSAELKAQYDAAMKDVNDQMAIVNLLYDQIDTHQKELETISSLIAEYTDLAAQKEKEIDELTEKMNQNYELFKKRLVLAQESGTMSYIDFILGSYDLSDIISRTEVLNDMLEYDRKIITSLKTDKEAIEKAKEEIDLALENCAAKQVEYEAVVEELQAKQAEAASKLEKLQGDAQLAKDAYDRAAASKKDVEDRLDRVIQDLANQSQGSYSGDFIWPLPVATPGAISQYFHSGHSGLDIHVFGWANNGKIPALAIASGKVVRVGYYSDWGNLVVVDHGGGYLSYYAHLHTISVSYGQYVSQGQQVGKIGSTGQSTGPHLHLVIYAPVGPNGTSIRTDPLNYISFPR